MATSGRAAIDPNFRSKGPRHTLGTTVTITSRPMPSSSSFFHDATGGIQPEGTAPGEHHPVDHLPVTHRVQCVRVPGTGGASRTSTPVTAPSGQRITVRPCRLPDPPPDRTESRGSHVSSLSPYGILSKPSSTKKGEKSAQRRSIPPPRTTHQVADSWSRRTRASPHSINIPSPYGEDQVPGWAKS